MLDINEELSKFEFIDVEIVEEKIGRIPDDMKNAIDLYNKALDDLRSNNEDIAIIALKKAIAIYPAFYEAMNLMGICFLKLDDEDNARRMFNKVIQMDDNSIRASRYLDQLDGKITSEEINAAKSKRFRKVAATADWLRSGLSPEKNSPYFLKYILGVLIGILAMCLVWIIVPEGSPLSIDFGDLFKKSAETSPEIKKLEAEKAELTTRLRDANEALAQANETEKQLRDQMEQYVHWSAILRNLETLYWEGKYKEVIIQVERDLAGLEIPEDIALEIEALNNKSKPRAISQFYESARSIYKSNSNARSLDLYKESADEFRMAISIIDEMDPKPNIAVDVYYYGGKAIALSQYPSKEAAEEEALRCFNAVIEIAPGSQMASYARSRIRDIEEGRTIKH
jgi:tetratricopeptide (TPR) repeat protein